MGDFSKQLERVKDRRDGLKEWLKEKFPQIFDEQAHLDKGSVERYYWHYGYMIALNDLLKLSIKNISEVKEEFPKYDKIIIIGDRSDWIEYGCSVKDWFKKWFGD